MGLENEKEMLKSQLFQTEEKIIEISSEIQDLFDRDDYLRNFVDIDPYDEDIREVGIGGGSFNKVEVNIFFDSEGSLLNDLTESIDKLYRQIDLEKESYEELEQAFIRNKELILHFPSIRPVVGGKTTDRFGYRRDPFAPSVKDYHSGIDIAAPRGTDVYTTADGVVIQAGPNGDYGRFILIDHGIEWGYETVYGHLSKIVVKVGQKVTRGEIIGEIGDTGRATAPHLHYEIRVNDSPTDPLFFYHDPELLM